MAASAFEGFRAGVSPLLMAIVSEGGALAARRALQGGADLVQVRAKRLSTRQLRSLVSEVIEECGGGQRVLVNSRPDIAELTGALGVHLPEDGLDPRSVRRSFPGLLVGVSRHDRPGLEAAVASGVDYALLGPVFETPGKGAWALGRDRFEEMGRGIAIPVFGVGGIDPATAGEVIAAGARGVAAIRPFHDPSGAFAAAASIRSGLEQTRALAR